MLFTAKKHTVETYADKVFTMYSGGFVTLVILLSLPINHFKDLCCKISRHYMVSHECQWEFYCNFILTSSWSTFHTLGCSRTHYAIPSRFPMGILIEILQESCKNSSGNLLLITKNSWRDIIEFFKTAADISSKFFEKIR